MIKIKNNKILIKWNLIKLTVKIQMMILVIITCKYFLTKSIKIDNIFMRSLWLLIIYHLQNLIKRRKNRIKFKKNKHK